MSLRNLKDFLLESPSRINEHTKTMATKLGCPLYLTAPTRNKDLARKMVENRVKSYAFHISRISLVVIRMRRFSMF